MPQLFHHVKDLRFSQRWLWRVMFWDIMPCSQLKINRGCGEPIASIFRVEMFCLLPASCWACSSTLTELFYPHIRFLWLLLGHKNNFAFISYTELVSLWWFSGECSEVFKGQCGELLNDSLVEVGCIWKEALAWWVIRFHIYWVLNHVCLMRNVLLHFHPFCVYPYCVLNCKLRSYRNVVIY
jgi:hypothetical protein